MTLGVIVSSRGRLLHEVIATNHEDCCKKSKVHPPKDEGDTRPISLTPSLSKVLEDFVTWLIDINGKKNSSDA